MSLRCCEEGCEGMEFAGEIPKDMQRSEMLFQRSIKSRPGRKAESGSSPVLASQQSCSGEARSTD